MGLTRNPLLKNTIEKVIAIQARNDFFLIPFFTQKHIEFFQKTTDFSKNYMDLALLIFF